VERLNEKNFVEFAVQHYSNPRCLSADEFFDDLARFKYVKRLLNRYLKNNELQERLVLNHIISIYNVFSIAAANTMIFYKCEESTWPALKAFLEFLNYLPSDFKPEVESDLAVQSKLEQI
jgi:hypothetical protein